jgi:hypothetical protein
MAIRALHPFPPLDSRTLPLYVLLGLGVTRQ